MLTSSFSKSGLNPAKSLDLFTPNNQFGFNNFILSYNGFKACLGTNYFFDESLLLAFALFLKYLLNNELC